MGSIQNCLSVVPRILCLGWLDWLVGVWIGTQGSFHELGKVNVLDYIELKLSLMSYLCLQDT